MKAKIFTFFSLTVVAALLLTLLPGATLFTAAQEPEPPCPTKCLPGSPLQPENGPCCAPDGTWYMPADHMPPVQPPPSISPQATGGPDEFGYTWDDTVPLKWISAKGGTATGIDKDTDHVGPIDIGFSFKYYENIYTQLYISRFGFVAFNDNSIYNSQSRIPSPGKPNDVIAPHWVPADDVNGYVRYLRGGAAPSRWFVVEWNRLESGGYLGDPEVYTFEVILHENGDIVFQYGKMKFDGSYWCQASGIEDSTGLDGLSITPFCQQIKPNHAVRIYRPAPSARVKVYPLYQGDFTRAGRRAAFRVPIRNTGELGGDTYDLFVSSRWPVALYAADGTTRLADTDGDGKVDTGLVPQGGATAIVVKVSTPKTADVGDDNVASVTIRSSLDTGESKTVHLQTAVPAPFAQAYVDGADAAMSLYLARPNSQVAKKATPDWYYGYYMAVAEMPGSFAYVWARGRSVANVYVMEIEYTLLDRSGRRVRPVTKLTDHSGAAVRTYDYAPAVAVAPNGRIGIVWYRYLYNSSNSNRNYNIYYAILDASGNVAVPPTNLTNNSAWGPWGALYVPEFTAPRIAATTDNRFVLAWQRYENTTNGSVSDIYYTIRDTGGAVVKPITRFTYDTPGWEEGFYYPNLAPLSGNRVLFVWRRSSDGQIYYAVLDSAGNAITASRPTGAQGWGPDAVQLSNGNTLIAWTGSANIGFAVLNRGYKVIAGPTTLSNPAAVTGDDYVSVTADNAGRAILTWMDRDWSFRRNLYYALVGGRGQVLTHPMIFRTSQATDPYIFTSYEGYGNTSYLHAPSTAEEEGFELPSLDLD